MIYISKGEDFDDSSNFAVYKKISELGKGGYGIVYYAQNTLNNEHVAIKMLDRTKVKSAGEIEVLFKEIQSLRNLLHKNILKIISCYYL